MLSLGIDVGYSSVKLVVLGTDDKLEYMVYRLHRGRIRESLHEALEQMGRQVVPERIGYGAMTGSGCKHLSALCSATYANDVACLVEGALWADCRVRSIIEIGGQGAKYVTGFGRRDRSRIEVSVNPNCSAGTGSFLEEQVARLGLDIKDYSSLADKAQTIPRIAGRCSVFAKTDITHHQQEGVAVEDILLGLAYAVVRSYRTAVMRRMPLNTPVMVAGGVAHNQAILRALRDIIKLEEPELVVLPASDIVGAAGAATIARAKDSPLDVGRLVREARQMPRVIDCGGAGLPRLARHGQGDAHGKHERPPGQGTPAEGHFYLGIDVGSTSTNAVVADADGRLVTYRYLRTRGRPRRAVAQALRQIRDELGESIHVAGVGVTGSGRYMIGRLVGADVIKDEITAQAKAAVALDPEVDTVFEIGGQDSKYIRLDEGVVVDFQMNRVCSAGTGSFLEEQARKLGLGVNSLGDAALAGLGPIDLGERCTVFMESSVAAHLSHGAAVDDLVSGLCYSIVRNYLHRVVGHRPVGDRVFLQGGVAFNQGVVNAFRVLMGKDVRVPPFFSVTGAYGAALLARAEVSERPSAFRGFVLSTVDLPGEAPSHCASNASEGFDQRAAGLVFEGYDGVMDPSRETIGMPRALFAFGMYPMFRTFFNELGYNVLLSSPTSEATIRLCQEYVLEETCFPVKLVNGHVAELVSRGVDYLFFPDLYTVPHPGSPSRQDYGCAYMQLAFKLVSHAMDLDKRGITLLAPTIAFSLGQDFMRRSFVALGERLHRGPQQIDRAMQHGMRAYQAFERRIENYALEEARNIAPDQRTLVLISKIYGVADPVLNMGIPDKLSQMGYPVLPFYALPEVSISGQHPNMFWPFGQHILETARLVREHPNLNAIFLTHHGCGPDTVFTHYFREIMKGKPYLNIEVDEHSSTVGVITRVEAFVNSLGPVPSSEPAAMETYHRSAADRDRPVYIEASPRSLPKGTTAWLPRIHPYSEVTADLLEARGIRARVLPAMDQRAVNKGREYTLTNEYFSMTALLGAVLEFLRGREKERRDAAILLLQTEGAEVDGQYARLLRCKLDEQGFGDVAVAAPFLEDLVGLDEADVEEVFACLLAGDLVMAAPRDSRPSWLKRIRTMAAESRLSLESLEELARELSGTSFSKRILALGEPMVLFDDFMNNSVLRRLEETGHRVCYMPMSECLWTFWMDWQDQNPGPQSPIHLQRLERFRSAMGEVSRALAGCSPFAPDPEALRAVADSTIGHYSGAFGRYRMARMLVGLDHTDGIVNLTSMYENTGISLSVLRRAMGNSKPVLDLALDGNVTEADETKLESFLHYL